MLRALEGETIVAVADFAADEGLASSPPLTSRGTRIRQTTAGALLGSACRESLQVDVAMINGGSIKGNRDYPSGQMSYLDLQVELPFPTKMVAVRMPGHVLQAALEYSRRGAPDVHFI